jgi:hypothetical protein
VRSYLAKDAKKIESAKQALIAEQISSPELVARIYFWVSWVIIGLLGCFVLFLAYVLAVSIDHRIEQSSMEHAPYVE